MIFGVDYGAGVFVSWDIDVLVAFFLRVRGVVIVVAVRVFGFGALVLAYVRAE